MAIHSDIMAVQRENHREGHLVVPHSFHGRQKLPDPAQESRAFFNAIFEKAKADSESTANDDGATYKKFVKAGGMRDPRGRVMPSRKYMLKPYYEDFDEWDYAYGYPIAGWAELATQALMHAGGLGHASQRVHAHVPSGGSPVLAVEIEPGMHRIGSASIDDRFEGGRWFGERHGYGKVIIPRHVREDAAKIAALDFLTNNQDRNQANLLFRPNYTDDGKTEMDNLLSIDHGRSFQYAHGNRFNVSGPGFDDPGSSDHLFHYMRTPGLNLFELRHGRNLKVVMTAISDWWKKHGPAIRAEMHKQVRGIKIPQFADHIEEQFGKRADALDKMVKTFKRKGHMAYTAHGLDKKAWGELRVETGGHMPPSNKWMGSKVNNDEGDVTGGAGADLCPSCGQCLTCDPDHTVGRTPAVDSNEGKQGLGGWGKAIEANIGGMGNKLKGA